MSSNTSCWGGDFSFALSLANSFASAFNIVATSLDNYDTLIKKYNKAKSNLDWLKKLGASLIHGVDATKMKLHTDLKMRKFDRIIYNFPHAGFHGKEDRVHLIKKHRRLVRGFFHNASAMLRPNGEIHVSHKISPPFCHWNLKELASQNSLLLIECVPFKMEDYPGYNNKRGDGLRCDDPFPLGECSTFKFILVRGSISKKTLYNVQKNELCHPLHQILPREENQTSACGTNYHVPEPEYRFGNLLSGYAGSLFSEVDQRFKEECSWIFHWYFTHVRETFGLPEERIGYNVQEAVNRGLERFVDMACGRPLTDFIVYLEELHRLSVLRIVWLEQSLAAGMYYH